MNWKEIIIEKFKLDEETTISLIKNTFNDEYRHYSVVKNGYLSLHEGRLNKIDAENIYYLYKNKILNFNKDEHIKRLWDEIYSNEEYIEKLWDDIKNLEKTINKLRGR